MEITPEKLVRLYFEVKKLAIFAEETDPDFLEFIQPDAELVRALDHIMRAQAENLGLRQKTDSPDRPRNQEYIAAQHDKAYGHLYRAFFDTADWLSMNLREKIQNHIEVGSLDGVSLDCLTVAFPEYYQTIKPGILEAEKKIVALRLGKDVATDRIIDEVAEYKAVLGELEKYGRLILERRPLINDCEARRTASQKKTNKANAYIAVGAAIAGAVVGAVLAAFLTLRAMSPSPTEIQKTSAQSAGAVAPATTPGPAQK